MNVKFISTLFAVTALVSFSTSAFSSSMCESIQQQAAQATAAYNAAHQTWQQVCTASPNSSQCAIANTDLMQAANTANSLNAAAATCRIFYMEK